MTQNAKMRAPKEMQIETFAPGDTASELRIARKRMTNMCATGEEIELYRGNPVAARGNRHPAIPCEDYAQDD